MRGIGDLSEASGALNEGQVRSAPHQFEHLRRSPLFQGVDGRLVEDLLARCSSKSFKPGATIVEQDQKLDALVMISRGLVDLTRIEGGREFGVLLLASNDVLMPAAAIFREPCLVTARSLVRTKVCSIPVLAVSAVMRNSPQFAANLMAVTSGQWRMSVRNILDLSSRTAAQRVAAFLLRLVDLQRDAVVPVLPIAKRHLAARLGMTPETLSRMLQTVAKNGLYLRGRTIIVKDRACIEKFCGPDLYRERDEHNLGVFAL